METFLELTKLSIRRQITYRAATLAGLSTNLFFGFLRAYVMIALYGSNRVVAGLSLQDAITYTGLTQASIAYLSLFSWFEIIYTVISGKIGSDLLKPMGFFTYWMAQDLGRACVNLVTRGLTIMVLYAIFFDIKVPGSTFQWLSLIVAIILAWMVSYSWRFTINLAAFWIPDAIGFSRLFFALSWFLSGFLMPLSFLPDWFIKLCYFTPFPHMVYTPVEIYLGLIPGNEIIFALSAQLGWFVILYFIGQLILRSGLNRLVIQGG